MQVRLKSPITAQLELTTACNALCEHCYNFWRYTTEGVHDNRDDRHRSLSHFQLLLQTLIDWDVQIITFTGGEPFLRRDLLFPLIVQAKSAGRVVSVNTNGSLIRDEDSLRLKDLGVDQVLVSLLSALTTTHDRIVHGRLHGRTVQGIERLIEANVCVSVNMVVSRLNFAEIRATAQLVRELGAQSFSATPILSCPLAKTHGDLMLTRDQVRQVFHDLYWARQELGLPTDVLEPVTHCVFSEEERYQFQDMLGHHYCAAGISDCVISADGDVRPCILSSEVRGNLLTDGWEQCWSNLSQWGQPTMLPTICRNCVSVDSCGGGCRVAALARHGTIDAPDPYVMGPLSGATYLMNHSAEHIHLLPDDQLVLHPDLRMRPEAFGGVLILGKRLLFLKESGFAFVRLLVGRPPWSVFELATELQLEQRELEPLIQTLACSGFVTREKGGEKLAQ